MRTWLNVSILSIVLVIMVGFNGLMDGWFDKARIDSVEWEFASGQLWSPSYDPYDALKLPDAHEPVEDRLSAMVEKGEITPVLAVPASVFPSGRMVNVVLKGIDENQEMIKIHAPAASCDGVDIPVVLGKEMARSLSLEEGDLIMARWRDRNGTFDARSLVVAGIFDTDNQRVDKGQIWMRLDDLRRMTLMEGQASYFICGEDFDEKAFADERWTYQPLEVLLKDQLLLEDASRVKTVSIFVILLSLALLTVFDTQTLSIFKRKKEIGTYVALGMKPRTVTALFTLEGTLYSVLAIGLSCIWGTPLLWLFKIYGFDFPAESVSGMMISEVMYPSYHLSTIVSTVLVVVVSSALISYFPARKISRMNMVLALKGKVE